MSIKDMLDELLSFFTRLIECLDSLILFNDVSVWDLMIGCFCISIVIGFIDIVLGRGEEI